MGENRHRHTVWMDDAVWDQVESHYQEDNCSTKNEYIEKAIQFYSGYLDAEQADEYLPRVLSDILDGKLGPWANGWDTCCSSWRWRRTSWEIWWPPGWRWIWTRCVRRGSGV